MQLVIRVHKEDFSQEREYQALREINPTSTGAICTFTGLVREFGDKNGVSGMFLEHYPGMTEKSLENIAQQAEQRWDIQACTIIHRVGALNLSEQIVFVGVCSAHRGDAFSACEFIMDYLKTDAPFWKKEINQQGESWVEAKDSDQTRMQNWTTSPRTSDESK